MLPSQVEPTARAVMGAVKRWYDHANGTATSAGTNTVTLTYTVAPTTYVAGDFYLFKAGGTNTGATTLNINALGAKTVQRAGVALVANDTVSGFYYGVVYDGTNFQIVFSSVQPAPALVSGAVLNPTGTTFNAGLVMMGLGGAWTITPNTSGRIIFAISGGISNSLGNGSAYQIFYGTGVAPINGAAQTGTGIGVAVSIPGTSANGMPFSAIGAGAFTRGTAYWFDLAVGSQFSGATQPFNLTVSALES